MATSAAPFPTGRLVRLAAVYTVSGATIQMFVDGIPTAAATGSAPVLPTLTGAIVGNSTAGSTGVLGWTAQHRVYNVARTAAQLLADAEQFAQA